MQQRRLDWMRYPQLFCAVWAVDLQHSHGMPRRTDIGGHISFRHHLANATETTSATASLTLQLLGGRRSYCFLVVFPSNHSRKMHRC